MIARTIWNTLCASGVHVVKRYESEYTSTTFDKRHSFTTGEYWTIVFWSVEGSCHNIKMPLKDELNTHFRHYRYHESNDNLYIAPETNFLALE